MDANIYKSCIKKWKERYRNYKFEFVSKPQLIYICMCSRRGPRQSKHSGSRTQYPTRRQFWCRPLVSRGSSPTSPPHLPPHPQPCWSHSPHPRQEAQDRDGQGDGAAAEYIYSHYSRYIHSLPMILLLYHIILYYIILYTWGRSKIKSSPWTNTFSRPVVSCNIYFNICLILTSFQSAVVVRIRNIYAKKHKLLVGCMSFEN